MSRTISLAKNTAIGTKRNIKKKMLSLFICNKRSFFFWALFEDVKCAMFPFTTTPTTTSLDNGDT